MFSLKRADIYHFNFARALDLSIFIISAIVSRKSFSSSVLDILVFFFTIITTIYDAKNKSLRIVSSVFPVTST